MHVIPHCPAAPVQRRDPQAKRPVSLAGPDAGAAVLEQSRFALCPSGTGGHSARLWQVIAAGAIPVIQTLTPGQALPGESAFWRKAAVFYDGSAETTAALPEQLNEMVTNRDQMGERYQTLTQIWLAYGPEGLTHGIHAVMASHADQRLAQRALATPGRISRTLRIYHLGLRATRTPLGYAPLARLAAGRITRAETPAEADLIMTGWNRDLAENPDLLAYAFAQNPSLRCAVISEEPLWDTVWSDGYEARARPFDCAGQTRSYRFLNHMNSRIFDFEHIPYFLLTADHFIPRYVAMLGRYAQMRPKTLLQIWRSTVTAAAFVSEYRDDPGFDVRDAGQGVEGLSRYRTMVAQMASHPKIWRIGYGWAGAQSRRQDLPDWHLDKLARLQGQVRLCASYENTHVHNYISEKPFDAFAVGAIPICYAGPQHRLHELIAPQAMLNTYGQPPETAAAWVDWFAPEMETAEAWLDTTARLRQRLTQADALAAERQRVVDETLGEIEAFLQTSV